LEEHSKFLMFLRPRRFGKSLFINMLAHYYGIHHASIFKQLFLKMVMSENFMKY
jgi:Predicted AAA-ATPase